jgi:hypothetical protein
LQARFRETDAAHDPEEGKGFLPLLNPGFRRGTVVRPRNEPRSYRLGHTHQSEHEEKKRGMGTGAYAAASEVEEDAERGQDDGEEDLEEGAAPVRRHRRDRNQLEAGKGDPSSLLFSRALVALPRLVWFVLPFDVSVDGQRVDDTASRSFAGTRGVGMKPQLGSGPSWAVIGDRASPHLSVKATAGRAVGEALSRYFHYAFARGRNEV